MYPTPVLLFVILWFLVVSVNDVKEATNTHPKRWHRFQSSSNTSLLFAFIPDSWQTSRPRRCSQSVLFFVSLFSWQSSRFGFAFHPSPGLPRIGQWHDAAELRPKRPLAPYLAELMQCFFRFHPFLRACVSFYAAAFLLGCLGERPSVLAWFPSMELATVGCSRPPCDGWCS